jgi:putative FmdB family regulatory protein
MPIYEYACPDCGVQNEHMQKLADAKIAVCPKCGSTNYTKKISAAGFALKGSGWYVTDFRNGNTGGKAADKKDDSAPKTDTAAPESSPAADSPASTPAAAPAPVAAPSPAPATTSAPAPAAG